VFELSPKPAAAWTEQVVHSFASGTDGVQVSGGVALDAAGNLYGATFVGGTHNEGLSTNSRPKPVAPGRKPSSTTLPAEPPMDGCLCLRNSRRGRQRYGTTEAGGPDARASVLNWRRKAAACGHSLDCMPWQWLGWCQSRRRRSSSHTAGNLYGTTYEGANTGKATAASEPSTIEPVGWRRLGPNPNSTVAALTTTLDIRRRA